MRILILGSVALPVPPVSHGGTERVAYYQALGLANLGHEITLVAPVGSKKSPSYTLMEIGKGDSVAGTSYATPSVEFYETSRLMRKESVYLSQVLDWLLANAARFDVILNNLRFAESLFLPVVKQINKPFINVLHLPLFSELAAQFKHYNNPLISISNAQREQFPDLNYLGTVYNPVDLKDFPLGQGSGGYLLMIAAIAPHKNQKAAIEAAKISGKKLILAGKIGNQQYFAKEIKPHIDSKVVEYVGEVELDQKVKLYQNAAAFIFPILWQEPFGLVMIEAMSCGTPVIAFANGAIPEVVVDGKSGFIIAARSEKREVSLRQGFEGRAKSKDWIVQKMSVAGLVEATGKISEIDRSTCRAQVEQNFSVETMNKSLEDILLKLQK